MTWQQSIPAFVHHHWGMLIFLALVIRLAVVRDPTKIDLRGEK